MAINQPAGSDVAFHDAFDACFRAAYQAAYRVLAVRLDAEDIAQEALTRAYVQWHNVHTYVEPWVVRVATNLALDQIRRQKRSRRGGGAATVVDEGIDERVDLARAIALLPKRQREVVALRYVADLSENEVMRVLGCSAGTVKQHAHRGLSALRASGHLDMETS